MIHNRTLDSRKTPISPHVISPFIPLKCPGSIVIHMSRMGLTVCVIWYPRELFWNNLINPKTKDPVMHYTTCKHKLDLCPQAMEWFVGVNDAKMVLQSPKCPFYSYSQTRVPQIIQLFWVGWVVPIPIFFKMVPTTSIRRKKSRPTSISSIY